MAWDATGETLRNLLAELGDIYKAAAELYADGHDNLEDVMGDISNVVRRLTEAEANITGMISKPNRGHGLLDRSATQSKSFVIERRAVERG